MNPEEVTAKTKRTFPARAVTAIVFALFSLWLMPTSIVSSTAHLQSAMHDPAFQGVRQSLAGHDRLVRTYLDIAQGGLVLAAIACSIWSWCTEKGIIVGVAYLFTLGAVGTCLLSIF